MKLLPLLLFICVTVVAVKSQIPCDNENPSALTGGDSFSEPPEISSENGELNITLTVEMAMVQFDWLCLHRRTYNGSIPGPTWRIKPGDTVRVNLVNQLTSTFVEDREINEMRFPNITNLHTHGLHVSSELGQDNVFVEVEEEGNGENEFPYVYEIDEENAPGTYWYHAHLHGSTMFQVQGGLAGLIIVEDPTTGIMAMPKHLADISCPDNCQHDHAFLFQPVLNYIDRETTFNTAGLERGFAQLQEQIRDDNVFRSNENTTSFGIPLHEWLTDPRNGIDHFTTNGILFPRLSMTTGQRKRFRLVHAGGDRTLELLITLNRTATDACEIYEIAFDGIYLDLVRKPKLGKSFLVPASKVDWIVVCNRPGTYELRSMPDQLDRCSIGDFVRHAGLLVTIVVSGSVIGSPPEQETALPKRSSISNDFRHLHHSQVESGFVIEANSRQHLNREHFSGPSHIRYTATVGTVQEWFLTNSDPVSGHPMHIHVNNFQIISYNNYTGPVSFPSVSNETNVVYYSQNAELCLHQREVGKFNLPIANRTGQCEKGELIDHVERATQAGPGTIGYVEPGEFRDVVLVPPLSNITIRFLAHRFTGEVVIHCHILVHEDFGMMMVVNIQNEGEADRSTLNSELGTPGKCREVCNSSGNSMFLHISTVLKVLLFLVSSAITFD